MCFIERATSPEQQELDWGLVVQISEAVNNTELGAKEARKLLQKKTVSSNAKTQALSLQVSKLCDGTCCIFQANIQN